MPRSSVFYLVSPAFAAADFGFGLPVRVAGLGLPWQRAVYYVLLVLLGLLCRARPAAAPWVGMAESSVNLFLLLLAILLPIWSMPETVLAGSEPAPFLSGVALTNAFISGLWLIVSFQRHRLATGVRPASLS